MQFLCFSIVALGWNKRHTNRRRIYGSNYPKILNFWNDCGICLRRNFPWLIHWSFWEVHLDTKCHLRGSLIPIDYLQTAVYWRLQNLHYFLDKSQDWNDYGQCPENIFLSILYPLLFISALSWTIFRRTVYKRTSICSILPTMGAICQNLHLRL